MRKVFLFQIVAFGATGLGLNAQETKAPPASPGAAQAITAPSPAARGDDEKAIKALLDAFTKAFNAGDAKAVAATYTETAVVVDEEGERIEGRAAVRDQYAASFADHPGRQDRHPGRLAPLPRPGDGPRGRPHHDHAGRGCRCARDHPLHRRLRQARRPVAAGRRARRARARPHPPRPPQGAGVARRRLGQREPGRGRLHHLQVGQGRQLPRSRVHHEDRRASPCSRAPSGSAGTR